MPCRHLYTSTAVLKEMYAYSEDITGVGAGYVDSFHRLTKMCRYCNIAYSIRSLYSNCKTVAMDRAFIVVLHDFKFNYYAVLQGGH